MLIWFLFLLFIRPSSELPVSVCGSYTAESLKGENYPDGEKGVEIVCSSDLVIHWKVIIKIICRPGRDKVELVKAQRTCLCRLRLTP